MSHHDTTDNYLDIMTRPELTGQAARLASIAQRRLQDAQSDPLLCSLLRDLTRIVEEIDRRTQNEADRHTATPVGPENTRFCANCSQRISMDHNGGDGYWIHNHNGSEACHV